MTTMVCFSAGGVRYAIPVDATLAVRTVDGAGDAARASGPTSSACSPAIRR